MNQDQQRDNRKSNVSQFYDNYSKQELLVKNIDCGGYTNQPICLYDFTVKNFQHDVLVFSTRHMQSEGVESFLDENYITTRSSDDKKQSKKNSRRS